MRSDARDFGGARRAFRLRFAVSAAISLGAALVWLAFFLPVRPVAPKPALVRDDAKLLSGNEVERLVRFHHFLLVDHDVDYRVQTVNEAGDLNRFAVETFEELGVGRNSERSRGLLLVVDPGADRVRLEVGRALEGSFPDAFVAYVEERQMVPFFRTGRVADGILATTELLVSRIQDEKRSGGFEDHPAAEGSAGGGAATAARIGSGEERASAGASPPAAPLVSSAADSPPAVVETYLRAMSERNGSPDLPIYTTETRHMLRSWTITPAQMDNVARTYRSCGTGTLQTSGTLAVVRYAVAARACAPFFLQREDGAWRLDLTMMQKAIRFGRDNSWRLDPAAEHPYAFAFADWHFDRNGFPVEPR